MADHSLELIRKAKKGDKEAFTALILENESMLGRVAMSILKNPEDSADAVQETVFAAWRGLGGLRAARYFKTWLTQILIRQCYALLHQRQKHGHEDLDDALDAARPAADRDALLDVRAALRELGEDDQVVLGFFYGDGLSAREIAQVLHLSETAVKQRLHRARRRFAVIYTEQEGLCYDK
ncbi:sigma-70 family RNA polymerase sigma factor [bacterium D16-76]|nr:sigma-70 family RNA polymerase sigma factor [bacterium D16-76]